jgi:hypothetical protein
LGDLGIDEKKLKHTLKKQGMKAWTGFNWLRIRLSGTLVNMVMNFQAALKQGFL